MELKKSFREEYKAGIRASAKNFALLEGGKPQPMSHTTDISNLITEAFNLEVRGENEKAFELLSPLVQKLPTFENTHSGNVLANLYLRIGSIYSAVGSSAQLQDYQEEARKFLYVAEEKFSQTENSDGVAQCRNKIGITRWRNGKLEAAKKLFFESLDLAQSDESLAIANLNIAMIESLQLHFTIAQSYYLEAYKFIGKVSLFTEAKIRNGLGMVYKDLGRNLPRDEQKELFDKAILEFEGALYCYDAVGNKRFAVLVRNNIGYLYYTIAMYSEAIRHLEIAKTQCYQIKDKYELGVVCDTLAMAYTALGEYPQAISAARASVSYYESFENSDLLSNSLVNYATALARLGDKDLARTKFLQAEEVAHFINDEKLAARARLIALRELFSDYSEDQKLSIYIDAIRNLAGKEEKEIIDALQEIAEKLETGKTSPEAQNLTLDENPLLPASLDEILKETSRKYIESAITKSNGNQSHAAALLGMSRQTFYARVKKDFPDLLQELKQIGKSEINIKVFPSHLIYTVSDSRNKNFAITELRSDFYKASKGDTLIVRLGSPAVNDHIVLQSTTSKSLKIGTYRKNSTGEYIESSDGSRLELSEVGKRTILGVVVGFCRAASYKKYLEDRNKGKVYDLDYEPI